MMLESLQTPLFAQPVASHAALSEPRTAPGRAVFGQYFTPEWAAHLLVERYFSALGAKDFVLEPTCGTGSFLKALPADVRAIGVEIDPVLAEEAALSSGREIITGDVCTVELPSGITAIVGNPPFRVSFISRLLSRAATLLPPEGRAGLLLPTYALQTPNTVEQWRRTFSISAEFVPRTLFPGLSKPLAFVMFTKTFERRLFGFALYRECVELERVADFAREVLTNGRPREGVWQALVRTVLTQLGGEADLSTLYQAIEPKRPTPTAFWKEQVRKVLQTHFYPTERGRWSVCPRGVAA